jgi:Flp pilus assembly protein TadB
MRARALSLQPARGLLSHAETMAELEQRPDERPPKPVARVSRATTWALGVLATLAIGATLVVSMGLASVVWVPLLLFTGSAMFGVWAARRRRQALEGRDANDIKDPLHAERAWPKRGITDDRLPEP